MLILRKAEEAVDKYKKALELYCDRDSEGAVEIFDLFNMNNAIDNDTFFGIKNALQKNLNRANEILSQHKEKIATQE